MEDQQDRNRQDGLDSELAGISFYDQTLLRYIRAGPTRETNNGKIDIDAFTERRLNVSYCFLYWI